MLQRIATNKHDISFISVNSEDVMKLKNSKIIFLNGECPKHSLCSLLVVVSRDYEELYLGNIDAFPLCSMEQVNTRIASCLISMAIEIHIRKSTEYNHLDINSFINNLVSSNIFEENEISTQPIAPFFKIAPKITDQRLRSIILWVDNYASHRQTHFYVHINNIRLNMSDEIISHCLSLLSINIHNTHTVFSTHGRIAGRINAEIRVIDLARLSKEESLSTLTLFCERNSVKCNRKLLRQVINLTECHPYYLRRLGNECLRQNITNHSIKEAWNKITDEIGLNNIAILHSLSNNAFNLLLGIALNANSKTTSKEFCDIYKIAIGSVQRAQEQLIKTCLAKVDGKQLIVDDPALKNYLKRIAT